MVQIERTALNTKKILILPSYSATNKSELYYAVTFFGKGNDFYCHLRFVCLVLCEKVPLVKITSCTSVWGRDPGQAWIDSSFMIKGRWTINYTKYPYILIGNYY